uniref:KIB1-4 beta-propeller domain-containing protein n=1 Tax=Leersia perrieri TaxID=77586 RepID=A0A0D9UXE8_9ORYZ
MESVAGDRRSDWAGLLDDILSIIMERLEIRDLVRSGAVCATWRATSAAIRRARFPLPSSAANQLPCLFYAAAGDKASPAVVHCPFTGESTRAAFPFAPVVAGYSTVGAGHGWIVTADEQSNLRLHNPITGAQASLPPITGIHHVDTFSSSAAAPMYKYNVLMRSGPGDDDMEPVPFGAGEARDCMYNRVVLSSSPSAASDCVALLAHMEDGELSYARVGDEQWTWISPDEHPCLRHSSGFVDFFHDDDKKLFYALRHDGSIYTLDLNGNSPIVTRIKGKTQPRMIPAGMYILRAPWGDILVVKRWRSYVDLMETSSDQNPDEIEDNLDSIVGINDEIYPYLELRTTDIEVFKVDFDRRRLVKMKKFDDHALFLGYNATMCLSTKDYPMLKPNCAYITDDSPEYISNYKDSWREIGIWDMEKKTLQRFECAEDSPPWLNFPSPVWIKV